MRNNTYQTFRGPTPSPFTFRPAILSGRPPAPNITYGHPYSPTSYNPNFMTAVATQYGPGFPLPIRPINPNVTINQSATTDTKPKSKLEISFVNPLFMAKIAKK